MLVGIDARYGLRSDRRGIGRYIYNLLEALEQEVKDERFVLYADSLAAPELVQRFSTSRFRVRILGPKTLFLWEQILLPVAALRDKIDLLHCPSNIAPIFKVCPTVLTIHDVIEFRRASFGDVALRLRHRFSRFYRMSLLPHLAARADTVITVSRFSREDIIEVLKIPESKVKVTYLGLPGEIVTGGAVNKADGPYIFALGAMDRRKNMETLLAAFDIIRAQGVAGIKLVIAGVEDLEVFYQKTGLKEHSFKEDIKCLGFASEAELKDLYKNCACFVYPSLYEGFGLPPLEAMALGAPVVASATTAVGEIVGPAGLLFDPTDPQDLAGKIKLLLDDPVTAASLRQKGRERSGIFSWPKCARETLQIYRDACAHGREKAAKLRRGE